MGKISKKLDELILKQEEYIDSLADDDENKSKAIKDLDWLLKMKHSGIRLTWSNVKIILSAMGATATGVFAVVKLVEAKDGIKKILEYEETGKLCSSVGRVLPNKIVDIFKK